MGRLENIIARNRRGGRPRERIITSLVFGSVILLILALMVFTDLGTPPTEEPAAVTPAAPRGPHADGVRLYNPNRRPKPTGSAQPAPSTPAP